jgi:beta-galactosidase/beta-glucuronidase
VEAGLELDVRLRDRIRIRSGICLLDWRPDGLRLDDSPIKLLGVCLHHDAGGLAAAVPGVVVCASSMTVQWLVRMDA